MSTALRLRIANSIIMSPPGLRISFTCGQISVNAISMNRVCAALFNVKIDAEVGPVPDGAAAYYDSKDDKYVLPNEAFGLIAEDAATLFHESVHALCDINAAYWLTKSESEAAAYTAGALYYRYATGQFYTQDHTHISPHRARADAIVQKIYDKPGASVDPSDVMMLRDAVMGQPLYRNQGQTVSSPSDYDGV